MKKLGIAVYLLQVFAFGFEGYINFNHIPNYVEESPPQEFIPDIPRAGSLFGTGDRPLFADRRAMKPDDLITIIIDESVNANLATIKAYNGTSNGSVTPPSLQYGGTDDEQKKATDELNNQTAYTLTKASNTTNFVGGGNQNHTDTLRATITARIIKVLENGNYFIAGQKEILVDGEKQVLQISGVVRPYDVEKNNSVQSRYLADAKIAYRSVGPISQTRSKKPVSDAIESLWPF
ncbi:MAG: flagellar basal body L-ring protein FlgH [Helicobacter sp.]|nr:flagellar basal body L-ring protein FlgH [Helicobacter sp.]MDD7566859.1 flagellar basal body L-ring protein FlgH [Helicobacter sp.]MDY5740194.1 flagellar basal body L-ring protein FlgH [Helicobacter sp.]